MKRYSILTAILFLGSSSGILAKDKLWTLPHSVAVYSEQNDKMKWGLSIKRDGDAFFARKEPVSIELYKDDGVIEKELYRKMTDKEQAPRLGTPIRK